MPRNLRPILTRNQRHITGLLIKHFRFQPEGPGKTIHEIAEITALPIKSVRNAIEPLSQTLRANGFALELIRDEDTLARAKTYRYRLAQPEPVSLETFATFPQAPVTA